MVYNTVALAAAPRETAQGPAPAAIISQGEFTGPGAIASLSPRAGEEQPAQATRSSVGYLYNPRPEYPAAARRLHLEGNVLLHVLVDETGSPDEIRIARSSGVELLDDAALAKVRTWRFTPARYGDAAIAHWVDIPIRFRLED